jgi:alpha-amylase/alpha-mannosidase (GH57 family)
MVKGKGFIGFFPILLVLIILSTVSNVPLQPQAQQYPVNVIIIWHMHQPWYYDAEGKYLMLPWVRMHSVGNYFKMADLLSEYPDVKVSFTFSGSLLTQLVDYYTKGVQDVRLNISLKLANGEELTVDEKFEMLKIPGGFFDINWARIVDQIPMYRALRTKLQVVSRQLSDLPFEEYKQQLTGAFTDQEYINLAVLFNLFWIDPSTIEKYYPDLQQLRQKALNGEDFTREELSTILQVHLDIMTKVIPKYKELAERGQIELVEVPYSHPLMAILADLGWQDDLRVHVEKGKEVFQEYFNYTPVGGWPPEQAINDYVAKAFADEGFSWIVTDENVLKLSGVDISNPLKKYKPYYVDFGGGKKIAVFFRDMALSNLLGFTYSGWDTEQAVNDFVTKLLTLSQYGDESLVYVIALDGENPWESYTNFGDDFIRGLYQRLTELQQEGKIRTLTPSEYLQLYGDSIDTLPLGQREYLDLTNKDISEISKYDQLPTKMIDAYLAESTWSGEGMRLKIWIGDKQENVAWMWLKAARETLLERSGVDSVLELEAVNPVGFNALLRAEASDWTFWYGRDMGDPSTFDPVYKAYLRKIYESVGIEPPSYLDAKFLPDGEPLWVLNEQPPTAFEEPPIIDGVANADEWDGAISIPIGSIYERALVGVDTDNIYIALTPVSSDTIGRDDLFIAFLVSSLEGVPVSPYGKGYNTYPPYVNSTELGLAITAAILIFPHNSSIKILYADGEERYFELRRTTYEVGSDIDVEVAIDANLLGIKAEERVYVTIAVYEVAGSTMSIVEHSTRLGKVYQIIRPAPAAAAGNEILRIQDPEGDDKGPGTYQYPLNSVFKPGVFDLLEFAVIDAGNNLQFEFVVKDLGGNPWGGPNGFSMQYFQVYIHTSDEAEGNTTTFGLNVLVDENDAWQVAMLVTPGWGERPPALIYPDGTEVTDITVKAVPPDKVVVKVSKGYLPNIENVNQWRYIVVLTSYDGFGPEFIRPFATEAAEWTVGGADAVAVVKEVVPRVMDLLAPTANEQYQMLSSFDTTTDPPKLAVIQAVSAVPQAPTTETVTTTVTETQTLTETETMISTQTTTEYETIESTVTSYETVTVEVFGAMATGLTALVIILAVAIIILMKRR